MVPFSNDGSSIGGTVILEKGRRKWLIEDKNSFGDSWFYFTRRYLSVGDIDINFQKKSPIGTYIFPFLENILEC